MQNLTGMDVARRWGKGTSANFFDKRSATAAKAKKRRGGGSAQEEKRYILNGINQGKQKMPHSPIKDRIFLELCTEAKTWRKARQERRSKTKVEKQYENSSKNTRTLLKHFATTPLTFVVDNDQDRFSTFLAKEGGKITVGESRTQRDASNGHARGGRERSGRKLDLNVSFAVQQREAVQSRPSPPPFSPTARRGPRWW